MPDDVIDDVRLLDDELDGDVDAESEGESAVRLDEELKFESEFDSPEDALWAFSRSFRSSSRNWSSSFRSPCCSSSLHSNDCISCSGSVVQRSCGAEGHAAEGGSEGRYGGGASHLPIELGVALR